MVSEFAPAISPRYCPPREAFSSELVLGIRVFGKNRRRSARKLSAISMSPAGFPARAVYARAEDLYKTIAAGEKRVVMDVSHMEPAGGDDPDSADM